MDDQEGGLRRARPDRQARRGPRHQHLDARRRRDRRRDAARPQDVLGMHFFSPANVMRLLEIVRGEKTAPRRARDRDGGRAQASARCRWWSASATASSATACCTSAPSEAERLLLEGALPQEVDAALTEFGFPMGPFAMGDLAGLDVGWRIRKARGAARRDRGHARARLGRFGQKTGARLFPSTRAARARRSPIRRSRRSSSTPRTGSASSAARSTKRRSSSAWSSR